jgi:hypothetical protein
MIGTRILPAQMADDACAAMTEPQRMAFSIQLVSKATERSSALPLRRLEQLSRDIRIDLERADQELRGRG